MGTDAFGRIHSLWSAVIGLAVRDAADENAEVRAEARAWLFGPGEDFEAVCELADLDPDWVRRVASRKLGIRAPVLMRRTAPRDRRPLARNARA